MSDHGVQSYNDGDGTVGQSRRPSQSAWMARLMDSSCKTAAGASLDYQVKGDNHDKKQRPLLGGSEIETNISLRAQGLKEVSKVRAAKIMDERKVTSSQNMKEEGHHSKPFPLFNICQNKENMVAVKTNKITIHSRERLGSQIYPCAGHDPVSVGKRASSFPSILKRVPAEAATPSTNCCIQPPKIVKFHNFFEKNSLAVSRSSEDDFAGSTFKTFPHGFSSRAPILTMLVGEEIDPSSSMLASKEHLVNSHHHSYSPCLAREKKLDHTINSRRPGFSLIGQDDAGLSLHDSLASKNQLPVNVGKQRKKAQDHIGKVSFSSKCSRPVPYKSEKSYQGCYAPPRVPCSVSDVENLRICTNTDSMEELSGHPSKIFRTTHRLLITEETEVNLSARGRMFRESTVSAKFKGKMLSEVLSFSEDIGLHGRQGVKLQLLGSSTDSEEIYYSGHIKTCATGLKNESSADTATMDMNALQENHLSGMPPPPSNKGLNECQVSPSSAVASVKGDTGQIIWNTDLLDMNQRFPAFQAAATSTDNKDTSSSGTQSLDVKRLISNAEQATDSKSNAWPGGLLGPDPSIRWVKRLKLNVSDSFFHGTKSSKVQEVSSNEKSNKSSKIMKGSKTSLEATESRCHGNDNMALDQTAVVLRIADPSTESGGGKFSDKTPTYSWIRRWCHNQSMTRKKNPEAVRIYEPESLNETSDKFQKKQFPSIAAMALMGKAITGFRSCEFHNMGSFVVWNTEGF